MARASTDRYDSDSPSVANRVGLRSGHTFFAGLAVTAPPDWPMRLALDLAREAGNRGEVPVGAVVIRNDLVLSQAYNLREATHDPTAHAECLALTLAGRSLRTWRLDDCSLYVTLEPCPMCAGAILQARIKTVIFAATDPKAGACRSLYRLLSDRRLNHRATVHDGMLAEESAQLLTDFFQVRRKLPAERSLPGRGA